MNNTQICRTALACAMTLGAASLTSTAAAQSTGPKAGTPAMKAWHQQMMKLVKEDHYAKCYGINAAYKNECGSPGNSCGWNDPTARDANAWVLVPAGLCQKIAGGSLKPAKS